MFGWSRGGCIPANLQQYTYDLYAYSNAPDDGDGSVFKPFNNLADLQTAAIAHGDGVKIGLVAGSVFRGGFNPGTVNNGRIVAVGDGDAPLICCDDIVLAGSFSKTGGYTNIYEVTLTVEPGALAAEWPGIWVDGTRLVWAASMAALDAAAGSYYHGTVTDLTEITLFIHSTGSSDPTSDGKLYEAAVRASGIDLYNATGWTVTGINARRNYTSYGSVTLGRNCRANAVRCSEGNAHNIFYRSGCTLTDVRADDAYAPGAVPTLFIGYEATAPAGATATLTRCQADQPAYIDSIGFYNHTGGATKFASINYVDCDTDNCSVAFSGADIEDLNITRGDITNYLVGFKSSADVMTMNGTTMGAANSGGYIGILDIDGIEATLQSVIASPDTTGRITSNKNNTTFNIMNCTFTACNEFISGTTGTGQTWNITGNSFVPGGRGYTVYTLTGADLTLNSDNNDFNDNPNPDIFIIGANTYADFAAYQAGTGQDANSLP